MNAEASTPAAQDHALLQAAGRGDRRAFARLMERHAAFAMALAQRMTGNAADADEMVQEAFLRVWKAAPQWRQERGAQFRTWLYRVVMNLCLDRARRQPFLPMDDVPEPVDPGRSGLENLSETRATEMVAALLGELPPRQRAAVVLCYLDDMTAAEAALVMEVSVSAMEALLVRARRALKDGLSRRGFAGLEDLL